MNGTSQIQCLQSIIIKRNIFYATICFKYSALGAEFRIVVNKYSSSVCLLLQDESLYVFPNCKSLWIKASAKLLNVNDMQFCILLFF